MSWVSSFDAAVLHAAQAVRSPAMTAVMRGITPLGGTLVATALVLVAAALLWGRGRRDLAVTVIMLVGGGALVSSTLKVVFARTRPLAELALIPLPSTRSFPSGHAMASLCIAVAAVFLAHRLGIRGRRLTLLVTGSALYALLVAFSRVYLGVHWPSDLAGSWLFGGLWCAGVLTGYRLIHRPGAPTVA